ncbi:DNA polymerase III epsilon subunit-like protein [Bradyrhizobium sp. LB8.2]
MTALTGITDEMVAGHRIDEAAVTAFAHDSAITIAHSSGFDRKFVERYWPVFEHKAWGCSATEIDWREHGFAGAQLGYLLNGAGFFHHAHRRSTTATLCWKSLPSNCLHGFARARPPARERPQANRANMGRAVAVRTQGFAEAARLPLE